MKDVFKSGVPRLWPCAMLVATTWWASPGTAQTSHPVAEESILQKRYEAAQKFQASGDLDHAAEQYRVFIADALGEVAIGNAQAGRYDKAQDDFDEALRLVPDFPMMQLEYARVAFKAGNLEHASLLVKSLLENYPQNKKVQTEAHALLGRLLMKMDKNAEARRELEAAIYLDPSFENGYELAVADLNLGDADAARKLFAEMLASFGDTAVLHMYFGQAYGNSDFQSDAVTEFLRAIAKDPRLPQVHYSLAVAYLATSGNSKLVDAEKALREEIEISPHEAAAYAALGHLLAIHADGPGDVTEAEADLKRATELEASNPDAFLYLGQFYADHKQLPQAEAALRQSIALTKDVSRNSFQVQKAHYLLARILLQSGEKEEGNQELAASQALLARNLELDQGRLSQYLGEDRKTGPATEFRQPMQAMLDVDRKQTRSPDSVDAFERRITPAVADSYNNLGAIAGSERNYKGALLSFRRAAEWQPSLAGLDFNWGRAAFEDADYAEAIGPLRRSLAVHPGEDQARRLLGLSEFMTKDYSAARRTLAPLMVSDGEASNVRFAYALSLLKTGEARGAIDRLELLRNESPMQAQVRSALCEAYATLGRDQLAQGNLEDAIANLQHAVELNPEDASIRASLQQASKRPRRD